MNTTFNSIVENVLKLSLDEKEELQALLMKYVLEARREEIHQKYLYSKKQLQHGILKFSDKIEDLRKELE
ncbi:MAG: hypothetical protein QME58_12375 [Bacteroidota bacterium]|nr:hypothetical protein [Bacteroidota bacterium]